ncbi:hypothetical protein ACS0TY_011864 [Phlomoides rotata]
MSLVLGGDLEGGEEDVLNLDFALMPTVVRTICLVGKICAPKAPNVFTLIEVMVKAFKPKGKLTHFDGHLFIIKPIVGAEQPSSIVIDTTSFWVRAHDLPMVFYSEEVIRYIAKKLGVLECFEKPSVDDPSDFVRFKVQLDIVKPLLHGIRIKLTNASLWILFSYESLPFFCYNCGCIGHLFNNFVSYDRDADVEFLYGGSLKAILSCRSYAPTTNY